MKTAALFLSDDVLVQSAVNAACQRIAPVWSLDKAIAVNPWWEMRNQPMSQVAAKLQAMADVKILMDKSYYLNAWGKQIKQEHLMAAANSLGIQTTQAALVAYLNEPEQSISWQHLGDLLDLQICHTHKIPWRDEVVQQVSQYCALYFQYPERMQSVEDAENGFYQVWLEVISQDKGVEVLMSTPGLHDQFTKLPNTINELFELAYQTVGNKVSEIEFTDYCHALLLDINGWASWMANMAWQAAFENKPNHLLKQLLAVRLAWDCVLWRYNEQRSPDKFALIRDAFTQQLHNAQQMQQTIMSDQSFAWVWQKALELSYQQQIHHLLLTAQHTIDQKPTEQTTPSLQAVFCIDVRSEPMRRALEAQNSSIQTMGFAGFFGLPIEYAIAQSNFVRPQLPGLLKASIRAVQPQNPLSAKASIYRRAVWKRSADAAPSTFGVVEATGLFKIIDLVKSSFFPSKPSQGIDSLMANDTWELSQGDKPLTDSDLAAMAAGILKAMNLTEHFAERILLVGHASCTTNNPHAAGLDCGACGGQSGEVNVKVLVQILNMKNIRAALTTHEISIPENTQFIACLHNTTTDELVCLDPEVKSKYAQEPWMNWLLSATALAQQVRAPSVGVHTNDADERKRSFERRANNWAQLRPEWGLANNAAFIVAPRQLTKNINLEGRSFLHDYNWKKDVDFKILELIMTAPMVVTHWINMQYYASVVDNQKYGSGNKLLHNVVGGNMGVFEGNGGDLRIGLPFQSIHDGQQWRHQPLRLNVYLKAPREAISNIIEQHIMLEDLIKNNWLYLFQLEDSGEHIWQCKGREWVAVS